MEEEVSVGSETRAGLGYRMEMQGFHRCPGKLVHKNYRKDLLKFYGIPFSAALH